MFIGHYGVAFGAKALSPKVSLGVLVFAAQWLDLLWPTLLLTGAEKVEIKPGIMTASPFDFTGYPYSHSLAMVLLWSLLFGIIYFLVKKDKSGALVVGICVLSHWILDLFMHRADLPLYPGDSPKFGWGLWNSFAGTQIAELVFIFTGVLLYTKATKPKNKTGIYSFWTFVVLLVALHFLNYFGPTPTSVSAIAWGAQLQWLFVLWAFWIDGNRVEKF